MPTPKAAPASKWLKPADLAAREGVHRNTLWRWAEKGVVEVRRRGPRVGVRMRMAEEEEED